MKKFIFPLVSLVFAVGSIFYAYGVNNYVNSKYEEPVKLDQQERVDQIMRETGMCRWWMLLRNLPDRAYDKPEQIPDLKFRLNMTQTCPESAPGFIGPQDKDYYEDRKRWRKNYGKYPEWNKETAK